MRHSEQKCVHFCSEWCIVGYGTSALCDLLIWSNGRRSFMRNRADSRFAPSQWETALLCNGVSHWLGASLESALKDDRRHWRAKGPKQWNDYPVVSSCLCVWHINLMWYRILISYFLTPPQLWNTLSLYKMVAILLTTFSIYFLAVEFRLKCIKVCSWGLFNWQLIIIGTDNGSTRNRRQAIV